MKWICGILLVLLCSCSITGQSVGNGFEGPYEVTYVVDGDTLDVNISERIRMSGINTPETGECYYQEAKDRLTELTLGKEVYLEPDISDRGNYSRLLRYVYVGDSNVNKVLVAEGYARVYDKYASDTSRYLELKEVETLAKAGGLGVWSCS